MVGNTMEQKEFLWEIMLVYIATLYMKLLVSEFSTELNFCIHIYQNLPHSGPDYSFHFLFLHYIQLSKLNQFVRKWKVIDRNKINFETTKQFYPFHFQAFVQQLR